MVGFDIGPDGPSRSNESSAWKLLRLWPLVFAFGGFIAGYLSLQSNAVVMADAIKETKADVKVHDQQIKLLEQQGVRTEERLKRADERAEDQRRTSDEIKTDVKRVLDLLQTTPGRR